MSFVKKCVILIFTLSERKEKPSRSKRARACERMEKEKMSVYLDNAATTQVCPEAAATAMDAMTVHYGNPSSTHRMGRESKALLERARKQVATALGARPEELFFTSCGSESDNWAILRAAAWNARHGRHIVSSMAEHPAVLKPLERLEQQGFSVTYLKPGPDGSISVSAALDALRDDTCLVTLMHVNNETGGVTDIAAIAEEVHTRNPHTLLHTDAVQAFLKIPLSARTLGADLISISGHKIHAPKGVGALYIRHGLNLPPLILGGGQEQGRRAGTESLPLIAAFGAAADAAGKTFAADTARMCVLRDHAAARLKDENPGLRTICGGAPQILSVSLPGYRSEVLMNFLEARDIFVSKSSACKKGGRSHVLEAIGLESAEIDGALRISLSRFTTEAEIDTLCDALHEARTTLRTAVNRR